MIEFFLSMSDARKLDGGNTLKMRLLFPFLYFFLRLLEWWNRRRK